VRKGGAHNKQQQQRHTKTTTTGREILAPETGPCFSKLFFKRLLFLCEFAFFAPSHWHHDGTFRKEDVLVTTITPWQR
jgi:hypothetical protein